MEEFKERLQLARLVSDRSDLRYIGTWHGVGKRLAQRSSLIPSGFVTFIGSNDDPTEMSSTFLLKIAENMGSPSSSFNSNSRVLKTIFDSIALKTIQARPLSNAENHAYFALIETQKEEKTVTFLSMIREMLTTHLFDETITHVFVDEAQDMGEGHSIYLKAIKERFPHVKLILVGDEKQGINNFMGASNSAFTSFPADFQAVFSSTYRLPKCILDYSNSIFISSRSPDAYVGLTTESLSPYKGSLREGDFFSTLEYVKEHIAKGESVMFLARHNSTVGEIYSLLMRHSIPFIVESEKKGVTQLHIDFAKEKALCIEHRAITSSMLDILNPLRSSGEKGLLNIRRKKGAIYVDHNRRDAYKTQQAQLASAQREFLFEAEEFDETEILSTDLSRLESVGLTARFAEDLLSDNLDYSFFVGGRGEKKKEVYILVNHWVKLYGRDIKPVSLMTIHKAKGLEADVTVLCTETFGSSERMERADPDSERRTWYVGATRSKKALYLSSIPSQSSRTRMLPRIN